ncbi:hypothetical protein RS130_03885 [Paraglaciecola aquimarina]|uniref:Uncharacterized protein n=1 Tax=Paraglaciecola aquimarina TaxID=1235557 RepID=A0ABU3ST46_9ALTE|nr:hypothetical protein [Paraglaciecola aquimarina]MDU0353186.1 hypothetical protein [Paraglaciecola aquimarina]
MSNWYEPILFGLALITFVLGLTSVIMGALPQPADKDTMQTKIEYGFFGVSGLVLFAVFLYALLTA